MRRSRKDKLIKLLVAPVYCGGAVVFALAVVAMSFRSARYHAKHGEPEDSLRRG